MVLQYLKCFLLLPSHSWYCHMVSIRNKHNKEWKAIFFCITTLSADFHEFRAQNYIPLPNTTSPIFWKAFLETSFSLYLFSHDTKKTATLVTSLWPLSYHPTVSPWKQSPLSPQASRSGTCFWTADSWEIINWFALNYFRSNAPLTNRAGGEELSKLLPTALVNQRV